jgi:hypothetical protein
MPSDGSRVAIGVPLNDGNVANSEKVRVYGLLGDSWKQVGLDIDSETAGDQSGWFVAMSSDGYHVTMGAVGAPGNDGNVAY